MSGETVGGAVDEYIGNSTAHGLPHIVSSKSKARRFIWLFIFVAALAGFVIQTTLLLISYYQWPVLVKTRIIPMKSVAFPAVTVCNLNIMRKSRLNGTRFESLTTMDNEYKNWFMSLKASFANNMPRSTMRRKRSTGDAIHEESGGTESDKRLRVHKKLHKHALHQFDNVPLDDPLLQKYMQLSANQLLNELKNNSDKLQKSYLSFLKNQALEYIQLEQSMYSSAAYISDETLHERIKRMIGLGSGDYDGSGNDDKSYWETMNGGPGSGFIDEGSHLSDLDVDSIDKLTDFRKLLNLSQTDDYSDISGLITPTAEELLNFSQKASDFIVQCSFDKRPCSYEDFEIYQSKRYGNCYTFNSALVSKDNLWNTTKWGSVYGLRLTLDLEEGEYIGFLSQSVGARVEVHDPFVTPFPEDSGLNASPNRKTQIGISMKSIKRKEHPYPSKCAQGDVYRKVLPRKFIIQSDDSEFINGSANSTSDGDGDNDFQGNATVELKSSYTVVECLSECLKDKLMKRCGCSEQIVTEANKTLKCNVLNETQERCRHTVYSMFNANTLGCKCDVPCHMNHYDKTISSAGWPSLPFSYFLYKAEEESLLPEGMEPEDATLSRVHVFLEYMSIHETYEEPAYSLETLLSGIGGSLGLYIGMSVCTACELFEFTYEIIRRFSRKRNERVKPMGSEKNDSSNDTKLTSVDC